MSISDVDPAYIKLRQTLKFTGEDLDENRQGLMSEAQKLYLLRFKKRFLYIFFALAGLEVFFYVLAVYFPADREPPPEWFFIAFGIMLILYIPLALFSWWRLIGEVQRGVVKTIHGVARFSEIGFFPKHRVLKIDNKLIAIQGGNIAAFEEGRTYAVYCVPKMGTVLAAELLDNDATQQ